MADEACAIGPSAPAESYLRIDRLLDAARRTQADAVHPGYGFLAENAQFASACRDAGLTFIGPAPEAIALMGSKTAARRAATAAGVPVVPGTEHPFGPSDPESAIASAAARIGYPLLIKAVAGGGGKGMRRVEGPDDLASAIRGARSEADTAFGDSALYLERRLLRPRHIEVQLLADQHGTVLPFVERECSIQRRHQKVIEETPSPGVSSALRAQLTAAAAAVARSVGYTSAGTIEFLVDEDGRFWFLEMNTRLQVEHPMTEMVTGVDLVEWQIRIARGETLDVDPDVALTPHGHAIECRIYAEDPDAGFMPSPGRITALRVPGGPWIRDDGGAESGAEVPIDYDPLISKLAAWGRDRAQALARMKRALREYEVLGIQTTVPFFRWILDQPAFETAAFHTGYLDELLQQRQGEPFVTADTDEEDVAAIAAALHALAQRDPVASGASPPRLRGGVPWLAPREQTNKSWKQRGRLEGLRA
jgi:acetyl-CoA carboxylase biotin carboxylase subunit